MSKQLLLGAACLVPVLCLSVVIEWMTGFVIQTTLCGGVVGAALDSVVLPCATPESTFSHSGGVWGMGVHTEPVAY